LKKAVLNFLKIGISLGLGIFLIYWYYSGLSENDKDEILNAFSNTNYGWILFSLVFAVLSHLSRAWRWKYTLEPLGLKPRFWNSFFSVMIAYLVNLAIPRLGEVSRCGVMSRFEGMPFQKLLGTVIAERLADFIILMSLTAFVVIIQFEIIGDFLITGFTDLSAKFSAGFVIGIFSFLAIGALAFFYILFRSKLDNPFIHKVRDFFRGLYDGILSILKMKDKWAFLGHTVFIWLMYLVMFYVCFFALPQTSEVPYGGVLTAFVMGGFAIVFTNGGIGAYPLIIMAVLSLYGVEPNIGGAFGWVVWTAQTVMLIVLGALSFLFMPIYNNFQKKRKANAIPG